MVHFSAPLTMDFVPSRRLALLDFFIFRWFIPVLPRRIFPVAVFSNLFAAVLHVFSFGTRIPH